jgi:hypothetical protein
MISSAVKKSGWVFSIVNILLSHLAAASACDKALFKAALDEDAFAKPLNIISSSNEKSGVIRLIQLVP